MTQNLEEIRQNLLQQREELLQRLEAIRQDYSNGLPADFEEQAQQLENADVLAEISRVTNEELQKVSEAIDRIERELARR